MPSPFERMVHDVGESAGPTGAYHLDVDPRIVTPIIGAGTWDDTTADQVERLRDRLTSAGFLLGDTYVAPNSWGILVSHDPLVPGTQHFVDTCRVLSACVREVGLDDGSD